MNEGKLTLLCMFACKGDWNKELVPKDFVNNLLEHYRDYFDSDQKMKNGRQTSYNAFIYFVDRILPSINAEVTKYNGDVRCEVSMSKVFTITDEAYALLMVENYYERWVTLAKNKKRNDEGGGGSQESVNENSRHEQIVRARYTGSTNGNIHAGWEQKGIDRFNVLARMIRERRNDKVSNDNLDDTLRNVWRGMQKDTGSRRKPEEASIKKNEEPFEDEDDTL